MSSRTKVLELFGATSPPPSLREIATAVGISRERVRQLLAAEGLKSTRKTTGRPRTRPPRVWRNRFGHTRKVSTHNLGAVSELFVAGDLLARGWSVYRAMSAHCVCDLVACDGDHTYKIEVRSANRAASGAWTYNAKPRVDESYDVFALVLPDGTIRYKPDVFSAEQSAKQPP
jgi:hypothetical protein